MSIGGEQLALLKVALPPIQTELYPFVDMVAIDCEWNELTGELELIGVGNEDLVVQLWWEKMDAEQRGVAQVWIKRMAGMLPVVFHNAIADLKVLRQHGFDIRAKNFVALDDTMLMHAVLESELEHTLLYLHMEYGKLPPYKSLKGENLSLYNAGDVVSTLHVYKELRKRLDVDTGADFVYKTMSLPYIDLVIESEEAGIAVWQDKTQELKNVYQEKVFQAQGLMDAAAGYPVSPGSPDQLKQYFYNVEGMPIQRGKDDKVTTDKDAIASLRRMHGTEWNPDDAPTLDVALKNIEDDGHGGLEARYLYMGAKQALTHYVGPCLDVKRIYPECRLHVQASGRHSYVDPPLSQFRGVVEEQLIPDDATIWIGHDWSNIETWLLGGIANDPLILMAKSLNWDTHVINYCDITDTPYSPILTKALHTSPDCAEWRERIKWTGDEDIRRLFSKRFVYRVHYRGMAERCGDIPGAKLLGFDPKKLVAAANRYLDKHAPILAYWARIDDEADRLGLVRTFMGRPRRLNNPNRDARNREAANHELQGGVADIYATTALEVKRQAPWARLVYGKFDSMWWQVPIQRQFEFARLYTPIVTRPFDIRGVTMAFPASFKLKVRPNVIYMGNV